MRKFHGVAILCALFGLQGRNVVAQVQNISVPFCSSHTFDWTFNKEDQSPCVVGAILQSLCFGNTWHMDPIQPGRQYGGPLGAQSNPCQCSTVAFSLVAACGACQGGGISSWTSWRTNCSETDVTIAGYPLTVPLSTRVPAWAYLNVTATGNIWDQTAALAKAQSNAPESSGGGPPSTSSASGPAASPTTSTSPTASNPPSSSSSSKAGPIAGGVVGGVVGLAALALLCFILYRRRRRPAEPTHTTTNEQMDYAQVSSPISQGSTYFSHMRSPSDDPPKLYDPSDPSTFPPTPPQGQYLPPYPIQSPVTSFAVPGSHTELGRPVGYQGAPEV